MIGLYKGDNGTNRASPPNKVCGHRNILYNDRMAKKTTKAQRVLRIRAIYELLLTDAPRGDIIRYCYEKWGVSSKTVDNYLQSASALIIEQAIEMQQNALEKHLAQRALLRNKALKKGDERLAFDVLRDETKLLDLYPKGEGSSDDKPLIIKILKGVSMTDL